jgi:pimeloyl-ACP methyl ester carboxylesterase
MRSRHDFAAVNGTRLYYESAGTGPGLVLIHGFGLDRRMWDDQFGIFAQHYQVLRYDARGFGQSSPPLPDQPYRHEDDLRALLRHLGLERVCVLGLSMGGSIATNFALAYPDAVTALVLADSALFGYPPAPATAAPLAPAPADELERRTQLAARRAAYLASPLFAPAHEQPTVATRLRAIVDGYSGWHWYHADPQRRGEPPAAQRLGEIRAPTLVLVGARDVPLFQERAEILAQGIPAARKVVLPGVGHMANMEAPEPFCGQVLAFLTEAAPLSQRRAGPPDTGAS